MGVRLAKADRSLLGREHAAEDLQIVRAAGSRVWDARGREYIDFTMGWCVGNLGWNHPDILDRLRRFEGPVYVNPGYLYEPWTEVAGLLARLTPGKVRRSFRAVGGTEAVELALQIAAVYTGRHKFVSLEGAYHGDSVLAHSIGDGELDVRVPGCAKLRPPLDDKALDRLDTKLAHRDVAAFIMEPIVINLGVLRPDDAFMRDLVALCHRHGTLVVIDEVASGFGRTGAMFGCEHFGLEPDIITVAKALTGGHAPMGAAITTSAIADAVEDELEFYSTFGWHPLSCEAAIAALGHYEAHRDELLTNVAARSEDFRRRLGEIDFASPAEIRIVGLAIAVDFEDDAYAERLAAACRRRGLLVGGEEGALTMFPAINLDRETALAGLEILEECA